MEKSEAWFTQRKRGARPLVASWRGWVAGLVLMSAFFGLCIFFMSLNPFEPLDLVLLGAWWLSILGLWLVYHLIARRRTYRAWQQDDHRTTAGKPGET